MDLKFRLYDGGGLQFVEPRVTAPLSFAHVTDLHMAPHPPELWPKPYRRAVEWWAIEMKWPGTVLPGVLDDIQAAGVDFVFFGGDVLDYYHPEPADRVVRLCRERGLEAHFQIGNHDWESDYIRYITHDLDADVRARNCATLAKHWQMPGLYYSFEKAGVRFIALDTPYDRPEGTWAGRFDDAQADWFIEQLRFDGPIVVFHHIPFVVPTHEPRLRAFWSGGLAGVAEDGPGGRVLEAIQTCPNILGTFVGHAHMRSENPHGQTWQFMTDATYHNAWRYVKIDRVTPPKSQRVPDTAEVWMAEDKQRQSDGAT